MFLFVIVWMISCVDSSANNNTCVPFVSVNETINLDLPRYINLRVPGGWAYAPGGYQGLVIYNVNGQQFKAFDRMCPGQSLSSCSVMEVASNNRLLCNCDNSEYNILNGSPLTPGVDCFAREYNVENLNGTVLNVSNF